MKIMITAFCTVVAILGTALITRGADALTQRLQQGLFEEEANQNIEAAIKAYQSVISQAEEQRKVTATALFRLGECYRKLGKTNEATAQYQRIVRDFSEQEQLVKLSREQVASLTSAPPDRSFPVPFGGSPTGSPDLGPTLSAYDEMRELARIKALIKESPDLVNGRGSAVNANSGDTMLHKAAAAGYYSVAELLLANGANVNAESNNRLTPLHRAAVSGYKGVVELLLTHGADANRKDSEGATPLYYAADHGYKGIVELLLAHKADANVSARTGYLPLQVAARNGFVGVCEVLLDHGAFLSAQNKPNQPTALHHAAGQGHRDVVELFLKRKADINARDSVGETPLRWAAKQGRPEIVKILVENGADPNLQDNSGEFPLFGISNTEVMQLLLQHKADPNLKTRSGNTALAQLQVMNLGSYDAMELLLENRADPNCASQINEANLFGQPLLYAAVSRRDVRLVELLAEHGAKPNVLIQGETPFSIAQRSLNQLASATWPGAAQAQGEYEQIAKLLLGHGANPNLQRFSTISYRRPGWSGATTLFTRGTNDFNRYTLLELFGMLWSETGAHPVQPQIPLPFPDLAHITIARLDPATSKAQEIKVDLDEMLQSGDCSKDVPLEWGDQILVPERDHQLGVAWDVPEPELRELLENCLTRLVKVIVKRETNTVALTPAVRRPPPGFGERRAERERAKKERNVSVFRLKQVVYGAQVLRASSDVTHVRVRRIDPETKQQSEWTINLTRIQGGPQPPPGGYPPPPGSSEVRDLIPADQDLWLRGGDVIEIPDKQ